VAMAYMPRYCAIKPDVFLCSRTAYRPTFKFGSYGIRPLYVRCPYGVRPLFARCSPVVRVPRTPYANNGTRPSGSLLLRTHCSELHQQLGNSVKQDVVVTQRYNTSGPIATLSCVYKNKDRRLINSAATNMGLRPSDPLWMSTS